MCSSQDDQDVRVDVNYVTRVLPDYAEIKVLDYRIDSAFRPIKSSEYIRK